MYVADPTTTEHHCVELGTSEKATPKGPNGESFAWFLDDMAGEDEGCQDDLPRLSEEELIGKK